MKKLIFGAVTVSLGILLAGCSASSTAGQAPTQTSGSTVTSPAPAGAAGQNPDAAAKKGTTTKTGRLSKAGDKYFLQVSGQNIGIDSYNVDFSSYVGKTITVSGEYSGDTLFVTKIN